ESPSKSTISFTVQDNSSVMSYLVVLSDDTGKVIDWKALTKELKQQFEFNGDALTITIIQKELWQGQYSVTLKTYTDVFKGDYIISSRYGGLSTEPFVSTGTISLEFNDIFYNLYPDSENELVREQKYYGNTGDVKSVTLSLKDSPINLYVGLNKYDGNPHRYYFNPLVKMGETLVFNNNVYNSLPVMKTKYANVGEITSANVYVLGNATKSKKQIVATNIYSSVVSGSEVPIYYPDALLGNLFTDFTTNISYYDKTGGYNAIRSRSREPLDSYQPLDVNFNFSDSTKIKTTSKLISFPVTGKAQYMGIMFSKVEINATHKWFIYSEFTNNASITLPVFPDELYKNAGLTFIEKMRREKVWFVENNNLGSYTAFYTAHMKGKGQTDTSDNLRQKAYDFTPSILFGDEEGRKSRNE
ncbi:MAG TPA: hypothetical protein VIT44_02145, partial [Cyclobacteriaceae bacterium]